MALKKRTKVSAKFSMSSLTDIIFLLLIFFMLTSSLVAPNALNLKLPGSRSSKSIPSSNIDDVTIKKSGRFYLNGKRVSLSSLERELAKKARRSSKKINITISPASGTPVQYVAQVMDIALKHHINGILATELK